MICLYRVASLFNVYDSNTLVSMMYNLQPMNSDYLMGLTPKEFGIILSERENSIAQGNQSTI